jgi:hypothetical protein
VKYFVLVFDTERGELVDLAEFPDAASAFQLRQSKEGRHPAESIVEVAILRASSKAALRKSHPRYFAKSRPTTISP